MIFESHPRPSTQIAKILISYYTIHRLTGFNKIDDLN